jgi:excisionase family DNA binding protein
MDCVTHTATPSTPHEPVRRGPITVDQLRRQPTVSVEQAAGLLGISRAYAYQRTKDGEIDSIVLGNGRYRVKSSALLRLLGEDSGAGD